MMHQTPAAQWNCRVLPEEKGGVTLYRLHVENPRVSQRFPECNKDFDTDAASVLAAFSLPLAEKPEGMTAVYQHKSWWIRPAFPTAFSQVPERTQLLLWKQGETFCGMLAVCSAEYRGDLQGTENGICVTVSANGCPGDENSPVVCCAAQGKDPYLLVEQMAAAALESQGRLHALRKNKRFPELFQSFGWCTWDALYHKVNEADIFAKLEEFRQKGVPARWLLIDDGWSDANYETKKLNSLGAEPVKFPQGIGHTARTAKERYGIRWVGVWHALMGYWSGLNPGSEIFRQWEPKLERKNGADYVLRPTEEVNFEFYDQWHTRLEKEDSIDFVKVDGQGSCSIYYKEEAAYGQAAGFLRALERSAAANFGGNLINCMGMAPQCMWLRENSALSRSSDDFVPEVPHGFREHILQNSFNSLLQGQFYWGDWDMFWSSHVESSQNSVARSVSGGPVYCSDRVGATDPASIRPLLNRDGSVNRCEGVGVPTLDCLLSDPLEREGLFKIFNTYGDGYAVAVFNIASDEHPITDSLTPACIPGLEGQEWLVYRYFGQKLEPLGEGISITLEPNEVEHLLLLPRHPVGQFIGDPEKYICNCTVREQSADGEKLTGTLLASSRILFRTEKRPVRVLIDGREVPFAQIDGCYEIPCGAAGAVQVTVNFS